MGTVVGQGAAVMHRMCVCRIVADTHTRALSAASGLHQNCGEMKDHGMHRKTSLSSRLSQGGMHDNVKNVPVKALRYITHPYSYIVVGNL